jgi:hypothetical protein
MMMMFLCVYILHYICTNSKSFNNTKIFINSQNLHIHLPMIAVGLFRNGLMINITHCLRMDIDYFFTND